MGQDAHQGGGCGRSSLAKSEPPKEEKQECSEEPELAMLRSDGATINPPAMKVPSTGSRLRPIIKKNKRKDSQH